MVDPGMISQGEEVILAGVRQVVVSEALEAEVSGVAAPEAPGN